MADLPRYYLILYISKTETGQGQVAYLPVEKQFKHRSCRLAGHCELHTARQIVLKKYQFIGALVRNPLDWYRSALQY